MIFLGTEINDDMANVVVAQLLFWRPKIPTRTIHLYINSPGGSVTAGLAIYDTMQFVRPDVSTTCVGQAASMGSLAAGRGSSGQAQRALQLPHHDPPALGGARGQATDIDIQATEILKLREPDERDSCRYHTGRTGRRRSRRHRARLLSVGAEEARSTVMSTTVVSRAP